MSELHHSETVSVSVRDVHRGASEALDAHTEIPPCPQTRRRNLGFPQYPHSGRRLSQRVFLDLHTSHAVGPHVLIRARTRSRLIDAATMVASWAHGDDVRAIPFCFKTELVTVAKGMSRMAPTPFHGETSGRRTLSGVQTKSGARITNTRPSSLADLESRTTI